MADRFHTLIVSALTQLTDDAIMVSFAVPDTLADVFAFTPGQYLTLRTQVASEDLRRAYSICSTPTDTLLSVGIRHLDHGRFSRLQIKR